MKKECEECSNPPVIEDQIFTVLENSPIGTIVDTIQIEEPDGDPVFFEIVEGNNAGIFDLDAKSGVLIVADSAHLDYEKATKHTIVVKVTDNSKNKLSNVAVITINVVDIKPTKNGLIAYYPFNGNANDESGNNHHGSNFGATLTTDRFGQQNSAYQFDGIDDYIKVSNNSLLKNNNFSYSWWVNVKSLPAYGAGSNMLEIGSICSTVKYGQVISLNNNYVDDSHGWVVTSGNIDGTRVFYTGNDVLPNLNEWYHLTLIRDNVSVKLYVNDHLIFSQKTDGAEAFFTSPLDFYIGSRCGAELHFFNGIIDDIRIYNRALTKEEINTLYAEDN